MKDRMTDRQKNRHKKHVNGHSQKKKEKRSPGYENQPLKPVKTLLTDNVYWTRITVEDGMLVWTVYPHTAELTSPSVQLGTCRHGLTAMTYLCAP